MNIRSEALRIFAAWAVVVGATSVLAGCGAETPVEQKPESTSPPVAAAPPKPLSAAEKAALKRKQLTEDEPSAQERRKARLKAKGAE
jgi:hypothetical protein